VDLLGIHGVNTPERLDWCLRSGGCVEAAQRLREQGKIRFLGFSTHGSTAVIESAIASSQFDYVNLHWYYIFQEESSLSAPMTRAGCSTIRPKD